MANEIVTDWLGNPVARLSKNGDKTVVTDWKGNPLGTADDKGTRDFLGVPLSPQNNPGILIEWGKK